MAGKFIAAKSRSWTPLIFIPPLIISQGQSAFGALFDTEATRYALEGYRFIVMVAHETPQTFRHANETANTGIFGYADNTVIALRNRTGRAHFGAIAALVANFNFMLAAVFNNINGAFFPVGCFEIGLGTDLFAGTAAGTFGSVRYQLFHLILLLFISISFQYKKIHA